MARRRHTFAIGEYYHCYNRGTEKRLVFCDSQDFNYFLNSLKAYNDTTVLGKLRLHSNAKIGKKLAEVVAFSLLPNHFHFVLKELEQNGISKLLQRLGIGYTMYFNQKYKRSGGLFQGTFKSKHLETDQDLRQVTAYVAYNNRIHSINDKMLYRSSLDSGGPASRDLNWDSKDLTDFEEIVSIIKEQRLSFNHD